MSSVVHLLVFVVRSDPHAAVQEVVELALRCALGGREDMIVDVALELANQRAA